VILEAVTFIAERRIVVQCDTPTRVYHAPILVLVQDSYSFDYRHVPVTLVLLPLATDPLLDSYLWQ